MNIINKHHELIAYKYVNVIASTIEQFHLGDTFHSGYPRQVYLDMAWGGLHKTIAFEKLDSSTKERILSVIAGEATGKDYNGVDKKQNGAKIECNEKTN